MRRWAVLATIIVLAGGAAVACTRPWHVAFQTARLLPALFGSQADLPLSGGSESVSKSALQIPGGTILLYSPAAGRHPALVISLGIEPAPPDDPRVVTLLTGLARDGVVAALVDSPELDAGRLTPDASSLLVSAFQATAAQPSVLPERVGFLGLSVGGSLVLLAAADPRISARVRLVEAVGAYDSLGSLARSVLTKTAERNGHLEPWEPAPLATQAVRENLTALLAPPELEHLLTIKDAQGFDAALLALPTGERSALDALSPAIKLMQISAPVFLMVDHSDSFVPPSESAAIASDLRRSGASVYFSSFGILQHAELRGVHDPLLLASDVARLFVHVSAVLSRL